MVTLGGTLIYFVHVLPRYCIDSMKLRPVYGDNLFTKSSHFLRFLIYCSTALLSPESAYSYLTAAFISTLLTFMLLCSK
jgi:hypothetical protein